MVKRGEGIFLEEGTIVFVHGQIIEARTGRLREAGARNLLSTWENCRFLFVPSTSEAGVNGSSPPLPAPGHATNTPMPGSSAHSNNILQPGPQTPMPSSLHEQEGLRDRPAERTPYLIQDLDVALRFIEQQRLSRVYRQLLFLIDGRRSFIDLARLTGKLESELYRLLGDLERAHIIRIR
jgi:hypothetical protein